MEFFGHNFIANQLLITKNYGVSFSMNWINILYLNILFILIVSYFYFKNKSYFVSLILIGGIINLSDRLVFGYVRDYWNFGGILINNLNDWFIGVGVLLFLLETIWNKQR